MRLTILAPARAGADEVFAPVVGQVAAALRKGGHRVSILGVHDDVGKLVSGLKRRQPDLVFNLLDRSPDTPNPQATLGILDMLGVPYTGNGPGEAYLQGDDELTRRLLGLEQIPCRSAACKCPSTDLSVFGRTRPPPRTSVCVDCAHSAYFRPTAVATGRPDYRTDHQFAHAESLSWFHVGILGNQALTAFPPVAENLLHDGDAMSNVGDIGPAAEQVALAAYRAMRVRDYGRVHLGVAAEGEVFVVRVEGNCSLEQTDEYARAAAAAGMDYVCLVNQIVELAAERASQQPSVQLI